MVAEIVVAPWEEMPMALWMEPFERGSSGCGEKMTPSWWQFVYAASTIKRQLMISEATLLLLGTGRL